MKKFKIFIGWAGSTSLEVAAALSHYLPMMFHAVAPWFSSSEIEVGVLWREELETQLRKADAGILCLTGENFHEPWIIHEAATLGTLGKPVWNYLFELRPEEIRGPLADTRQVATADKRGTKGLLHAINKALSPSLRNRNLDNLFTDLWPKLEEQLQGINPILRIYSTRRENPDFRGDLIRHLEAVPKGSEVLMMGNTFHEFFGDTHDDGYLTALLDMLSRNIRIKIILLDPMRGGTAEYRASLAARAGRPYLKSTLLNRLRVVVRNLADLGRLGADANQMKKAKRNLRVCFSPLEPTTNLIITDSVTFVEQYHRGGGATGRKLGLHQAVCWGGCAPVLMLKSSSTYAKLLRSHFLNVWTKEENLPRYQKCLEGFASGGAGRAKSKVRVRR